MKDGEVAIIGGNLKEGWGLSFALLVPKPEGGFEKEGLDELNDYLSQGYEPFAVTPYVIVNLKKSLVGTSAPQPVQCDKVWLKTKTLVNKDDSKLDTGKKQA